MHSNRAPLLRRLRAPFAAALCCGLLLAAVAPAQAAPIPWQNRDLSITARDQSLREFLQHFFSQQGLAVQVSDAVRGQISGTFSPRSFDKIVRGFGLLPYYDGGVVYIYANSEAVSKTLSVDGSLVRNVVRTLALLEMPDQRNTFRALEKEGVITVNGAKRFVEQVEEVVRGTVARSISGPSRFRVFPLKNAWAWDISFSHAGKQYVVPGVASMLKALVSNAPGKLERAEQLRRPTAERLRGRGLGGIGNEQADTPANGAGNGADLLANDPNIALASMQGGRIEADRRTNAVIVRDTADRLPFYEELIKAIDVEPEVIEIEAAIIDVNADKLQELGVNWRLRSGRQDYLFGNGTQGDLRLREGTAPQDITPSGLGTFISATILGNNYAFLARVNALANEGDARIVARPRVLTMSNLEANIENNKTFYVRVQGFQEVDLFNVVSGTSLRVTPSVVREKDKARIRLLVTINDGKITGEQVDQIPVVDNTQLNTQTLINENESVLVGGLVREETFSSEYKVPLLGDIPLLGYLFKNTTKRQLKTERMFLITPRIIALSRLSELGREPEADAPQTKPAPTPPAATPPVSMSSAERVPAPRNSVQSQPPAGRPAAAPAEDVYR